jgi:replicative DNA helicase
MNLLASIDTEKKVLGAAILESDVYAEISPYLIKECFYHEGHQVIYEALSRLDNKGKPIDLVMVNAELGSMGKLEFVGGVHYLSELMTGVISGANAEYHAKIIQGLFVRRRLVAASEKLRGMGNNMQVGLDEMFEFYDKKVVAMDDFLTSGANKNGNISHGVKRVQEILDRRRECFESGELEGVTTGLTDLDRITNGWQGSGLYVIAGRPSMGKSALCLHFALAAARARKKVLYFSLEMSETQVIERLLFNYVSFDVEKFKSGTFTENDQAQLAKGMREIGDLNLEIDDSSGVSTSYIKSRIRAKIKREGCDLVVVDYIQKVTLANPDVDGERKYNEIAGDLKNVAKIFNIPVILCAQLNRQVENRTGAKRPQLSDLRDSGAIEQEADFVGFVYRPIYYGITEDPDTGKDTKGLGMLIVAKHRIGAIGDVFFRHGIAITKVRDDEGSTYDTDGIMNEIEIENETPF